MSLFTSIEPGRISMQNSILYIECGVTMRTTINTGIQRVVRNIIREAKQIAPQMGYDSVLVDFSGKNFSIVDDATTPEEVVQVPLWKQVLSAIDRKLLWLCSLGIYSRLRVPLKSLLIGVLSKKNHREVELNPFGPDGKPSVLLLLDSNWDNAIWSKVDAFRQSGGKVCAVLYDLIPFTHPDTVADSTRIAHSSWWSKVPDHIDAVMCISNAVREEFLKWQKRMSFQHPLPDQQVGYFHLGADLTTNDPVIRLLTDNEPYFLMVGSLEPRKNHKTVLDAFDRLWGEGKQLRLAIVGAYGWKSEVLLSRIQEHPLLNKRLFFIRDATDRDLVALYARAEALITASIAEGFGLPIIEALKHNTKVLCSDISVFREIAGKHAVYFEPLNQNDLALRIESMFPSTQAEERIKKADQSSCFRTWSESAEQLFTEVKKVL